MKMRPILMSTPMVQAILEGNKTMTRRVVPEKIINTYSDYDDYCNSVMPRDIPCTRTYEKEFYENRAKFTPGDILWVRETWCPMEKHFGAGTQPKYCYKADQTPESEQCRKDFGIPWRPSIFMPREAARIFLRVANVRVEQVQEITCKDALKEGFEGVPCPHVNRGVHGCEDCMDSGWLEPPQVNFMYLWDHLNAKRGYGWDVNPWVFVYEFERMDKPREV